MADHGRDGDESKPQKPSTFHQLARDFDTGLTGISCKVAAASWNGIQHERSLEWRLNTGYRRRPRRRLVGYCLASANVGPTAFDPAKILVCGQHLGRLTQRICRDPAHSRPCDRHEAYARFAPASQFEHPTSNIPNCIHHREMSRLDLFLNCSPSILGFTEDDLGPAPIPGPLLVAGALSEVCKRVKVSSPHFVTVLNGHNHHCVVLNRLPVRKTRRAKISCERHKVCMKTSND